MSGDEPFDGLPLAGAKRRVVVARQVAEEALCLGTDVHPCQDKKSL
jgi:hypothetical protein